MEAGKGAGKRGWEFRPALTRVSATLGGAFAAEIDGCSLICIRRWLRQSVTHYYGNRLCEVGRAGSRCLGRAPTSPETVPALCREASDIAGARGWKAGVCWGR